MGVTLYDAKNEESIFDVNFWNWRAIVEAVRRLQVVANDRVDALHEPFVGEATEAEAHAMAAAIRTHLLPTLRVGDRLLHDGRVTTEPDDGVMHYEPAEQHRNYSTSREVLEQFAEACARSTGFTVR